MPNASPRIAAVILAGGPTPASLVHLAPHRAVLPIEGRPIVALVAEALAGVTGLEAVVAVAPAETHAALAGLPCGLVAAGGSIVENMRRGAAAMAERRPTHLLFVTGDMPLLTAEAVSAFLATSLTTGAALTYPIIPREATEARFPGGRRTYVRIREGTFTGGNAILATAQLLDDKQALIDELYNGRKSPWKLAGLLGMGTVVRLLSGTLDLPYLEAVAGRILGAPARAIITPHPELGFDVDKPEDLAAVEAVLAGERTGG